MKRVKRSHNLLHIYSSYARENNVLRIHHMRDVLTFMEYLPVEACDVDAKDVASSQEELHMIHEL
jgi:hypothetical protein